MSTNTYFAYARHALVAGFRHLGIKSGDEIAVPELICRDVLASISTIGAVPRFYPVDQQLRPASRGQAESPSAVLMVNYFGFPQDISDFENLWPNAPIVEDNAHGYLSKDSDGANLGARTPVGVTSIRKTIFLPEGAVLSTKNPLDTLLVEPPDERRPSLSFRIRRSTAICERSSGLPTQQISRALIRGLRILQSGSALPKSNADTETALPAQKSISKWSLNHIESLDCEKEVERRRNLFAEVAAFAWSESVQPVFGSLPSGCSPYGFAFYGSEVPNSLQRLVRRLHCEIITWPDLPSSIVVAPDHHYRRLKVVNFL